MKQFEYKTIELEAERKFTWTMDINTSEMERTLNKLGAEGWELVNTVDYAFSGFTKKVILFFKREK